MPGPAETQIAVRAGTAEPGAMDLLPGKPIGPLSVGRLGTWRIVAPGVLEEHGFLYFNGTDLFLQSIDPNTPLLADGAPIPMDWTAIYAPCEIAIGGARLWFGSPHGGAASMRGAPAPRAPAVSASAPSQPPPAEVDDSLQTHQKNPFQGMAAGGPRPFTPRVQGNYDEEATRVAPVEQLAAMRSPRGPAAATTTLKSAQPTGPTFGAAPPAFGAAPPAFGAPPMGTPSFGPTPFVTDPQAPGPAAAPIVLPDPVMPPAAPPAKASWIGARWREASGPKKALMVLMAPLMWAVWVIFTDKPPPPAPPRPAASASAQPSALPSAGAPGADTQAAPAVQPPAPASAKATASTAPSTSPATTGPKTPQREAADAVAAGLYDRAATLYEELARAHPEVPAYAEAARIMKAKAGKR